MTKNQNKLKDLEIKTNEVIEFIYKIDKLKLESFLIVTINRISPISRYSDKINIIQEFNKYITAEYNLSKDRQILLCFFLSLFFVFLKKDIISSKIIDNKIVFEANKEKINIISNVSDIENKKNLTDFISVDESSYNNITLNKLMLLKISTLKNKNFNTIDLFEYVLHNYQFEISLTKRTVKDIQKVYLLFYRLIENTLIEKPNEEILNYIKKVQEFLIFCFKILK